MKSLHFNTRRFKNTLVLKTKKKNSRIDEFIKDFDNARYAWFEGNFDVVELFFKIYIVKGTEHKHSGTMRQDTEHPDHFPSP